MKLESVRRALRQDLAVARFLLQAGPKAQPMRPLNAGAEWSRGYWTGRLVQAEDDRERLKKVPL